MENTFGRNIIPDNEEERLENLKKYKILYTKSESVFDQLAAAAAAMLDTPLAMINFVDKDHVWTKSNHAGEIGYDLERGTSLCSLAILKDQATVFEDTLLEPFLLSNPIVAGEFGIRFYAAVPITTVEGFNIGVLCVLDRVSRKFTPEDKEKLEQVVRMIEEEIAKRLL